MPIAHAMSAKFKAAISQGVVTPIGAIVTAVTGVKKRPRSEQEAVKKRSRCQRQLHFLMVKPSRTIFKLGKAVKMQFWMVKFCGH